MKRVATLLLALATVVLVHGPTAAAPPEVRVRKIDTERFPTVTVTVSVETDQPLKASDVSVEEDGTTLADVELQPLTASGEAVDVVLLIDTSGSMQGQPIASAAAAALRFVTTLPDNVPVGVVTFSDSARVLRPISLDHAGALKALGGLKADGETALYDGVKAASALFGDDGQHNLVILSDGADTASKATLAQATGAAKHGDVSVFTVGLTSGEFDAAALKKLASATGGTYAPAATANLSSVYQGLATELTNQYLVTYSSLNKDGGATRVAVSALGGIDTTLVLTPKLDVPAAPKKHAPPPTPNPLVTALGGPAGLAIASLTCFLAVFVLMVMVLGTGARKRKDRELARRTAAKGRAAVVADAPSEGWVPDALVAAAERAGHVGGVSGKLEQKLENAGAPLRTGEFLLGVVVAAMVGALLGTVLLHNFFFTLLIGGTAAVIPFVWLTFIVRRRMGRLHGQLADILMIIANALRAGHSFMQALDLVAQEIGEPASEEFGRLVAEVRLGRPIEESLAALAERIGSEDFKWALLAVNIQREVGGNLAEVLDTVSDTIRERDAIRRQVDVLTAEGRLSVWILAALPIGVALYMAWVNPDYIGLLFNNGLGLLMTFVASCLLGVGIFWMKKVVKIDV